MKLYKEFIPHIENALGFKLHEHQVNYLLDKGNLVGGRRTGKTVAYCIKLALSDGEPLDLKKPEEFADGWSLPNHNRYARSFFRNEFMKYRQILKDYGFPVREVKR
jgi:hypothetical protein